MGSCPLSLRRLILGLSKTGFSSRGLVLVDTVVSGRNRNVSFCCIHVPWQKGWTGFVSPHFVFL